MIEGQRRRFLVEGAWVVTGQFLSALGSLLGLRVLTEVLSPHVFGEVVLISGIVLLVNGITANPLMQGVLRYYPEAAAANGLDHLRKVTNRHLVAAMILSSAICLAGFLIYSHFIPINLWLGILVVGLLILDVIRQRELVFLNAARQQRITAIWSTADVWARPAVAYGIIMVAGGTAVATLVGYIVASLFLILVFMPWFVGRDMQNVSGSRSPTSISPESSIQSRSEDSAENKQQLEQTLMRYSIPLMPLGVIGWISGQADRYLVAGMIGVEEAGIYAAIYGIVSRPFLMAAGTLESWIRPVYYEAIVSGAALRERKLFLTWLISMACIAGVGIVSFSLWHEGVAAVFLAPPYRTASWIMPWIGTGYGLLMVAQVYERVCYGHNDTKSVLLTETIGSLVGLIATVYGVTHFGFAGAACAVPIYFGVQLISAIVLARYSEGRRRIALWAGREASAWGTK